MNTKTGRIKYDASFCDELLQFFDGSAFTITEVQKRDGSLSLVETAAELPTFAAFAKKNWRHVRGAFRLGSQIPRF